MPLERKSSALSVPSVVKRIPSSVPGTSNSALAPYRLHRPIAHSTIVNTTLTSTEVASGK